MGYPPLKGRFCTCSAPVCRSHKVLLQYLPLDLHVLGLPLAFILSQDQTLHCKWIVRSDQYNLMIKLIVSRRCWFFIFDPDVFLPVCPIKDAPSFLTVVLPYFKDLFCYLLSNPTFGRGAKVTNLYQTAKSNFRLIPVLFFSHSNVSFFKSYSSRLPECKDNRSF